MTRRIVTLRQSAPDLGERAAGPREIDVPPAVEAALQAGATLSVSHSGGKDGQTALRRLSEMRKTRGWPGRPVCLRSDLGDFEWQETPGTVEEHARRYGAELIVVRRERGGLLDRIRHEARRLAGTGRIV